MGLKRNHRVKDNLMLTKKIPDAASGLKNKFAYWNVYCCNFAALQPTFTCSRLTIETLKQSVKYVQS